MCRINLFSFCCVWLKKNIVLSYSRELLVHFLLTLFKLGSGFFSENFTFNNKNFSNDHVYNFLNPPHYFHYIDSIKFGRGTHWPIRIGSWCNHLIVVLLIRHNIVLNILLLKYTKTPIGIHFNCIICNKTLLSFSIIPKLFLIFQIKPAEKLWL